MIQDRNVHRDAQLIRKVISIPIISPTDVDRDIPIYSTRPRYNWRVSDLSVSTVGHSVATMIVKVQGVRPRNAVGSPQFGQNSAPTFNLENFYAARNPGSGFGFFSSLGTLSFTNPFTILDGFWGVVLSHGDTFGEFTAFTSAASAVMAFPTEELALQSCPRVPPGQGRVAILTIQAVGGDFIAQTTNTDAALVAAFNTAPQDGHVALILASGNNQDFQATLGQQLKDASGEPILQGKADSDLIALTVRSAGAPVIVGPSSAIIEYRPWPVGGEGLGDVSVSQTPSQFVP